MRAAVGAAGGAVTDKQRFKTTTAGLGRLAGWLAERQVALVAMEATGVCWKVVQYALEDRFQVWLCNATTSERARPQDRHV